MKVMVIKVNVKPMVWSLISLVATIGLVACGGSQTKQPQENTTGSTTSILIDGSSTVYPISEEVAREYEFSNKNAPKIDVQFSGTGGGFKKFCTGQTDVSNASRPIKKAEMSLCKENSVEYIEIPVAYDALTIVVHPNNTWVDSITVDELKKMWEPQAEGKVTKWNQVRSSWPDRPLQLYGPGKDSGTFDYFTEAIMGKSGESRNDYGDSEDDTVLARAVKRSPDALAYFGYAYYEENQTALKAVPVDSGNGAIAPSNATVVSGAYTPLARPLFIYVSKKSLDEKPELKAFVKFYITNAETVAKVVGYTPLPDEAYALALEHFNQGKVGTVFNGEAKPGVTIEALLKQEANF